MASYQTVKGFEANVILTYGTVQSVSAPWRFDVVCYLGGASQWYDPLISAGMLARARWLSYERPPVT